MTTPYKLLGDELCHRDGPSGGPSFKIDWEKRQVTHVEEGEVVPGSEPRARTHSENVEIKSQASAGPAKPPPGGADLSKL